MSQIVGTVSQALQLRRWALDVLGGHNLPAPSCSATGWRLFLDAERCAVRLGLALGPESAGVPEPGCEMLEGEVLRETQKALMVQSHLSVLAEIAASEDYEVVALKGAIAATEVKTSLDVYDIDILVRPEHARDLAEELGSRGYRAVGWASPQHLQGRHSVGGLPIEIHVSLDPAGALPSRDVWQSVVPLQRFPPLRRLSPVEYLWHLLTHVGVHHPGRRGALRDLLLMKLAAAECEPSELEEVRSRIGKHVLGAELGKMLTACVHVGEPGDEAQDGFMTERAVVLVTAAISNRLPLPKVLTSEIAQWAHAYQLTSADRRLLWRQVFAERRDVSGVTWIAAVERRSRVLGRWLRGLARLVGQVAAMKLALPVAATARRLARQVLQTMNQRP